MQHLRRENGVSLVEVLAGFIILSIILVSFLSILLQTKKTNASSENIQEATYVAQAQMEALYLYANRENSLSIFNSNEITLNGITYEKNSELNSDYHACKTLQAGQLTNSITYAIIQNPYNYKMKIDLICKPNNNVIGRVVIELEDSNLNKTKVKIENAYIWK